MDNLKKIQSKILSLDELKEIRRKLKDDNKTVVFSNGCFDILHLGHVQYLSKAADLGEVLIIGLNTDASVSKIKGLARPVQNNETRAMILASLQFVNFVVFFEEETPYNLIGEILPDILVKGSDYNIDSIVGADVVLQNGGKVLTIELTEGFSTTNIINKLLLHN